MSARFFPKTTPEFLAGAKRASAARRLPSGLPAARGLAVWREELNEAGFGGGLVEVGRLRKPLKAFRQPGEVKVATLPEIWQLQAFGRPSERWVSG